MWWKFSLLGQKGAVKRWADKPFSCQTFWPVTVGKAQVIVMQLMHADSLSHHHYRAVKRSAVQKAPSNQSAQQQTEKREQLWWAKQKLSSDVCRAGVERQQEERTMEHLLPWPPLWKTGICAIRILLLYHSYCRSQFFQNNSKYLIVYGNVDL